MLLLRWTPCFKQDADLLDAPEMAVFLAVLGTLRKTCGGYRPPHGIPVNPPWPTTLDIQPIRGSTNEIHAMTWKRDPPGYATFQWFFEGDDLVIMLRRIGGASTWSKP